MKLYLFQTIEDIKPHINIPPTLELEYLESSLNIAGRDYIKPAISEKLWDKLVLEYNKEQPSLTEKEHLLINKIRPALIRFALYQYYQENQAEWTGAGWAVRNQGGNFSAADYRDVNRGLVFLRNQGYIELEVLKTFIEDKRSDYSDYKNSHERTFSLRFFIHNSRAFNLSYQISPYTYYKISAQMEEVETFFLLPAIGQKYFDALKGKILDGLGPNDLLPIHYIRNAVAPLVLKTAIEMNIVQLLGNSVVQIEDFSSYEKKRTADPEKIEKALQNLELMSKRWLSKLIDELKSKPTIYTDFHSYLAKKAIENEESKSKDVIGIKNSKESGNFIT